MVREWCFGLKRKLDVCQALAGIKIKLWAPVEPRYGQDGV